jgi:hypothetical protein
MAWTTVASEIESRSGSLVRAVTDATAYLDAEATRSLLARVVDLRRTVSTTLFETPTMLVQTTDPARPDRDNGVTACEDARDMAHRQYATACEAVSLLRRTRKIIADARIMHDALANVRDRLDVPSDAVAAIAGDALAKIADEDREAQRERVERGIEAVAEGAGPRARTEVGRRLIELQSELVTRHTSGQSFVTAFELVREQRGGSEGSPTDATPAE